MRAGYTNFPGSKMSTNASLSRAYTLWIVFAYAFFCYLPCSKRRGSSKAVQNFHWRFSVKPRLGWPAGLTWRRENGFAHWRFSPYFGSVYVKFPRTSVGHAQRMFRVRIVTDRKHSDLSAYGSGPLNSRFRSRWLFASLARANNDNATRFVITATPQSLHRPPPAAVLKRINNDNNGPGFFRLSFYGYFIFFFFWLLQLFVIFKIF